MKKINLNLAIFCFLNLMLSEFSQVKAGMSSESKSVNVSPSQAVPEENILNSYNIGIQRKTYYILSDLSSQIEVQCVKSDREYKHYLDSYEFLFVGTAINEFSILSVYLSVKRPDDWFAHGENLSLSQLGFKSSKTISSSVNKIYRSDQYDSLRSCNDALELTKLHNEYVADSVRISNIAGASLREVEVQFNALK